MDSCLSRISKLGICFLILDFQFSISDTTWCIITAEMRQSSPQYITARFQSRKNNNNTIQAQRNDFHLLDCPCRYLYSFICFQIIIIVLPNTELFLKYELLAVVGCWREVFMQSNLSVCNHAASLQTFAFFILIFIQSLTIMFHERRSRPQHVANYIQMILLVLFVWLRSEVVLTTSVNIASEPDWPGFESTRCLKLPELETLSFIIS